MTGCSVRLLTGFTVRLLTACRFVCGFVSNILCGRASRGCRRRGFTPVRPCVAVRGCRFVCGFVSNLFLFPPDGGATNLVTPAWRAVSCMALWAISCVFVQTGGPANLVTPAWRAVSYAVLLAISCGVGPGAFWVRLGTRDWVHRGRGTRCTGGAGLGAPGAR